jgi:hypothetical protein
MARPGARRRIEQALAALQAEGRPATVRALRERAGGGSFSTVLAVLRTEAQRAAATYAPVHKAAGAMPVSSRVRPPDAPADAPAAPAVAAEPTPPELSRVHAQLERLTAEMQGLGDELRALRQAHAAELALAYERYESVQKYALREVDSARERAQDAQRALRELQAGIRTREDVFLQQAARLREELAFVRGELAEARTTAAARNDR